MIKARTYEDIRELSLIDLKQAKLEFTQKKGLLKDKISDLKSFLNTDLEDNEIMQDEIAQLSKKERHLGRLIQECDKCLLMLKEQSKANANMASIKSEQKESFHKRFVMIAQKMLNKDHFDLIVSATLSAIESNQNLV